MEPNTRTAKPLLTTAEVAARLGLTDAAVRNYVAEGRLPAVRLSRRVLRFRAEDIEALIDGHAVGGTT
jgi:excisionase family DNA binding protein